MGFGDAKRIIVKKAGVLECYSSEMCRLTNESVMSSTCGRQKRMTKIAIIVPRARSKPSCAVSWFVQNILKRIPAIVSTRPDVRMEMEDREIDS